MTIKMSAAVRNAMMNAYEATIGASAKILIYTGTPPANLTDAATGTLLATLALPADWMTAAASGVVSKNGTWTDVADAAGTAGYYRITATDGTTVHEQGTVAMSGGDMIINNTNIAVGQTVTVTTFSKTAGNP
jgi:hypothetical protein